MLSSSFRIISSSELQFFASRHAAAIAAVAAAALPPPPSSATNPNGVGLSSSASGLNAPPPIPSTHQHDFHPAYRIPGYMEHLYSLQHASAASSSSLHGKYTISYTLYKQNEWNKSIQTRLRFFFSHDKNANTYICDMVVFPIWKWKK